PGDDHHLVVADRGGDVGPAGRDRQLLGVGDRRDGDGGSRLGPALAAFGGLAGVLTCWPARSARRRLLAPRCGPGARTPTTGPAPTARRRLLLRPVAHNGPFSRVRRGSRALNPDRARYGRWARTGDRAPPSAGRGRGQR